MEECKYEQEKIKMEKIIDDDLEKSESDVPDNDETESDNESNEKFVKSILITIKR